MGDRNCGHCNNEKKDASTLEACFKCDGYTHHGCIERCPVSERRRFAYAYSNLRQYLTSVGRIF